MEESRCCGGEKDKDMNGQLPQICDVGALNFVKSQDTRPPTNVATPFPTACCLATYNRQLPNMFNRNNIPTIPNPFGSGQQQPPPSRRPLQQAPPTYEQKPSRPSGRAMRLRPYQLKEPAFVFGNM